MPSAGPALASEQLTLYRWYLSARQPAKAQAASLWHSGGSTGIRFLAQEDGIISPYTARAWHLLQSSSLIRYWLAVILHPHKLSVIEY